MGKIKVLIADDHTLFRQGLRQLLESIDDITVAGEANNGLEAEQLYNLLSPDVVLMDLAMPVLDGIKATQAILSHNPRAKVLALTMVAGEKEVLESIQAGAKGYVLKDCAVEELVQAIRAVHRGDGYFSPTVAAILSEELRRPHAPTTSVPHLSPAEAKVLSLLAQGMTNQEISQKLFLSPKTVRNRVSQLLEKLRLRNRTEAALYALKADIGHPEGIHAFLLEARDKEDSQSGHLSPSEQGTAEK